LLGIEAGAEHLGLDLMLFTSARSRSTGRRSLTETGWNRVAITSGCILLGRHDDKHDIKALLDQDFPFVFVGRRGDEHGVVPYVGVDYRSATREVTERLLTLGHQRIGFFGDLGQSESAIDRIVGYRDAMESAGFKPMLYSSAVFD